MDRRAFISGIAVGTLVAPAVARSQPGRGVFRIGLLGTIPKISEMVGPQPSSPPVNALLQGLRELGYAYGEHFVTEPRSAEGKFERIPSLVAQLVRLRVDVIVAAGPALETIRQASSTIPVVMAAAGDPVATGLAQSLGRPGGHFTGLSLQAVETTGKRIELLKELVPGTAPVAVLWEPSAVRVPLSWQAAEAAARARGWRVLSLEVRDGGEIERAFTAATKARAGGLLVLPSPLPDENAGRIAALAVKSRLPAMYALRPYVEAGGLIYYGANLVEIWRRAAVFVDKILKGAKPGDLPIEQPTKFELVINLKAAKAIGLTIVPSVLSRADEIMQ